MQLHNETELYENYITNFIKLSPSWEAASHAATQEFPTFDGT
jgi:hypothetical protein